MFQRFAQTVLFLLLLAVCSKAAPNIVQSLVVNFPINGRVIVQSHEEVGKFPKMVFISEKMRKVLLQSSIEDENKWLIPEAGDTLAPPDLRFRVIRSSGFKSPMVMSVGVYHGGSDSAYHLVVFGEFNGRLRRLNDTPMRTAIQGGYYLGYLNKKFGYGLAVWSFIWGDGINEGHYSEHKYAIGIYQLKGGRLKHTVRRVSKRMYDYDKGFLSLQELGIKVTDQRSGIPKIGETLTP